MTSKINSDCDNGDNRVIFSNCDNGVKFKFRCWGSWLSPLPYGEKNQCRYKWLIRPLILRNAIASLDWIGKSAPVPLQIKLLTWETQEQIEVFHLYRCYTHTHTPGRSRANPEMKGKRKKKADTNDGQKAKNSAGGGGERTDLQNQPTRRDGPDQNRAHT